MIIVQVATGRRKVKMTKEFGHGNQRWRKNSFNYTSVRRKKSTSLPISVVFNKRQHCSLPKCSVWPPLPLVAELPLVVFTCEIMNPSSSVVFIPVVFFSTQMFASANWSIYSSRQRQWGRRIQSQILFIYFLFFTLPLRLIDFTVAFPYIYHYTFSTLIPPLTSSMPIGFPLWFLSFIQIECLHCKMQNVEDSNLVFTIYLQPCISCLQFQNVVFLNCSFVRP